jgi:hypothetical protein
MDKRYKAQGPRLFQNTFDPFFTGFLIEIYFQLIACQNRGKHANLGKGRQIRS